MYCFILARTFAFCCLVITLCTFQCAVTAAVNESRRALKVNDVFFIVGVIVLIIAKMKALKCKPSA